MQSNTQMWGVACGLLAAACFRVHASGFVMVVAATVLYLLTQSPHEPYHPHARDADTSARVVEETSSAEEAEPPRDRPEGERIPLPRDVRRTTESCHALTRALMKDLFPPRQTSKLEEPSWAR